MMFSGKFLTWVLIFLLIFPSIFYKSHSKLDPDSSFAAKRKRMSEKVRKMKRNSVYTKPSRKASSVRHTIWMIPSWLPTWEERILDVINHPLRFHKLSKEQENDIFVPSCKISACNWRNHCLHKAQQRIKLEFLPYKAIGMLLNHEQFTLFVRFYHAYDNYMRYAFPHDELKPLTKTFTDSLSELGNLKLERLPEQYNGSALTLIESLSSLVIMGNHTEFKRAVLWLSDNLTFDVDARINLFECNIRLLGGLVSAHILAADSTNRLVQGTYNNQLLDLAEDLGRRFLPAFDTPTGLPYAWINLKYGVMENETTETSTSGCGSLILEMGALSRLTGDPRFESAALRALRNLWSMRSSLNLLGTTLDIATGEWIEYSSGIGAGVDSFYEYLIKAHILFGRDEFWRMFQSAYVAVQKYFRHGPWYHEADMRTGKATYWQLTSLQAFWPGVQVLVGDIAAANLTHREFFYLWKKYGVLPERYLLDHQILHPTEKYYPLRPELVESTFYLYQATKDPWYMEVGESIMDSLNLYTKVEGGFASIRDVTTMELEDHQHSFFLSETCKYLYLLYDDSFLDNRTYIFTTEGHPLPVMSSWHERLPLAYIPSNWTFIQNGEQAKRTSAMSRRVCPAATLDYGQGEQRIESACHIADARVDHKCSNDEECGVDSTNCRRRSCSMAGYCGQWFFV